MYKSMQCHPIAIEDIFLMPGVKVVTKLLMVQNDGFRQRVHHQRHRCDTVPQLGGIPPGENVIHPAGSRVGGVDYSM